MFSIVSPRVVPTKVIVLGLTLCVLLYMYYMHCELKRLDAKIVLLANQQQIGLEGFASALQHREDKDLVNGDDSEEVDEDFVQMMEVDSLDPNSKQLLNALISDNDNGSINITGVVIEEEPEVNEVNEEVNETVKEDKEEIVKEDVNESVEKEVKEEEKDPVVVDITNDILELRMDELRSKLKELGEDTKGTKIALQQRLALKLR